MNVRHIKDASPSRRAGGWQAAAGRAIWPTADYVLVCSRLTIKEAELVSVYNKLAVADARADWAEDQLRRFERTQLTP